VFTYTDVLGKVFQWVNFVQAVNTIVSAELWFKDSYFPNCLIWPSINDSITINPRGHTSIKIDMENILV